MLTAEHNWVLQAEGGIRKGVKIHIKWLGKAIFAINDELDSQISGSPSLREKDDLIKNVPGVLGR